MSESTRYYTDFKTLRATVWREFGKFPQVLIYPDLKNNHLVAFYCGDDHVATWDSAREAGYIFAEESNG